ncbi:MAG: 1-acyl-sn-glycerol-3-phosphate acyltransferase [Bdellovibrionales bacterium]|nr:1-acyl-sn-glycerol-3-phosphate acyltransferase [Bdellovibrionales bacterium]
MIFKFGRRLFQFAIKQFFSRIVIKGEAPLEKGAVLITPNHFNMLIDPLLICSVFRRDLWFLAKSTLFQHPLADWFLRQAHLVPVYRRQDNPADSGKNLETFRFAADALSRKRAVVIFPEGVSSGERRLAPLKTGAARIGLQAEEAHDFTLGVRMQPVGINYSELRQFQSTVTIYLGKAIELNRYKENYRNDTIATVKAVTEELEAGLKMVTAEVLSAQHEQLVERIAKLYQCHGSISDDYERLNTIAKNVEKLAPQFPERSIDFDSRIRSYLEMQESLGDFRSMQGFAGGGFLLRVLTAPFILWGVVFHYLPYRLTALFTRRISRHPASEASLKLVWGLADFLSWYLIVLTCLLYSGRGVFASIVSLIVCFFCAKLSLKYFQALRLQILCFLWPGRRNPVKVLDLMRSQLISELESLRVE